MNHREELLAEAGKIVTKDRNSVYGNPEDNFKDIASLWQAYKGTPFSSMDVVVMNMLIKVARLKKTPGYRDGLVDIAGYAACGADIQAGMQEQKQGIADYARAIQAGQGVAYPAQQTPPAQSPLDVLREVSSGYPTHDRRKS